MKKLVKTITKISVTVFAAFKLFELGYNAGFRKKLVSCVETVSDLKKKAFVIKGITFDSVSEAEQILDNMRNIIKNYGYVRVTDYYDLCGASSNLTDNDYGWYELESAYLIQTRNGWFIDFPKPCLID